jgi:hypothetical protein
MSERHTIDIPEWLWKAYQDRTGRDTPATEMRNVLSEHIYQNNHKPPMQSAAEPESIDEDEDIGMLMESSRLGTCTKCRGLIQPGEQMLWFTAKDGIKRGMHAWHRYPELKK